jgi:hypothetical protein
LSLLEKFPSSYPPRTIPHSKPLHGCSPRLPYYTVYELLLVNNWAKCFCTESCEIIDQIYDLIRKLAEGRDLRPTNIVRVRLA